MSASSVRHPQTKLSLNGSITLTLKARGPRRGALVRAPGPRSCGLAVGIRNINPCRWSTDRGPSKTNQRNLSPGNAGNRSTVHSLLPDRALVLCLRSTGLRKMAQEPRAGFHVAEWRVFCHPPKLRGCPARLNQFCSDSALMVSL